jgi:hypothetical protein
MELENMEYCKKKEKKEKKSINILSNKTSKF